MQVAKLNFRWEENKSAMEGWGYTTFKDLYCEDIETNINVRREKKTDKFYVCGLNIVDHEFADIRDAEEFAENEFKKYLNRFIVTATPAYDITAFARF